MDFAEFSVGPDIFVVLYHCNLWAQMCVIQQLLVWSAQRGHFWEHVLLWYFKLYVNAYMYMMHEVHLCEFIL